MRAVWLWGWMVLGCGEPVGDALETGGLDEEPQIEEDGTALHPFRIDVVDNFASYSDARDTRDALSDAWDVYPPHAQDESGPEFIYVFEVTAPVWFAAHLDSPEAEGVDNDLHLLDALLPEAILNRDNLAMSQRLDAGQYYLSVDTFVSDGEERGGPFQLNVELRPWQAGTVEEPIALGPMVDGSNILPIRYMDTRDTTDALGRDIDVYPPSTANESGPEFVYTFTVAEPVRVTASIRGPEPEGADIDLHLVSHVWPLELVERGNSMVHTVVEPGQYWIVADTFVSGDQEQTGVYELDVHVRSIDYEPDDFFNDYILDAVDLLYAEYGLLGYDSAVLTHDIEYGDYGIIERSGGAKTMCVGGMLEVILTAMQLYVEDTGDESIWDVLPQRSWERLGEGDFKAHLWVNYDLFAGGSADALRHFGMGENIGFKSLLPGSFINLNRTSGTGHAVVFLSYIDANGEEVATWNEEVVGFLYFSAQGGYEEGAGGLDYRYAVFSEFGKPAMPYKRDSGVIYREENDQKYLNTGMMYHPALWVQGLFSPQRLVIDPSIPDVDVSVFDPLYFDGVTLDDPR